MMLQKGATKGEIRLALLHAADGIMESTSVDPFIVDSNEPTVNAGKLTGEFRTLYWAKWINEGIPARITSKGLDRSV
jgi:hypothetical protein